MGVEDDYEGNYQDISVHDKDNAALGATEEEQNMDKLARVLVPMPAFTDPSNPKAAAGTINMTLDQHPVEHSPDYGADVHGTDPGTKQMQQTPDSEYQLDPDEEEEAAGTKDGGDGEQKKAAEWIDDVKAANSTEELDQVESSYKDSGQSFKTVDQAISDKRDELS